MHLSDIYKSIILSTGKLIDDEYNVYAVNPETGRDIKAMINLDGESLPLRLPVRSVLEARVQNDYIGFHPLSESHIKGESVVNTWLRRTIAARVTSTLGPLILELAHAATSQDVMSSADPDLLPLLQATKGADAKTVSNIAKVIDKVDNLTNVLCNIYIKREGRIIEDREEVLYERACITRFPIPLHDPAQVYGVPLRIGKIKDGEIIANLMELILPGWKTDAYSAGSNAKETPYFKSLMKAYYRIAKALNTCVLKHKHVIDDHEELLINVDWQEYMAELPDRMNEIPILPGNIGASKGKSESRPARTQMNLPDIRVSGQSEQRQEPASNPYSKPTVTIEPASTPANTYNPPAPPAGGLTSSAMMAARSGVASSPQQQPYVPQQQQYTPPQPHYIQQQQYAQQPQQYAHQQQQYAQQQQYYAQQQQQYVPPQQQYHIPQLAPTLNARDAAMQRIEHERQLRNSQQHMQGGYHRPY